MISLVLYLTLIQLINAVSLTIYSPAELKTEFGDEDGSIQVHLGNYGHIQYGLSQIGKLHYPYDNTNGCKKFTKDDFRNDPLFDETKDMTPIVLLDKGGCSHIAKTMNAQEFGLKAAVIEDDQWDDPARAYMNDPKRVEDNKIGYHLVIPYLRIFGEDMAKLKKHLKVKDAVPVFIKLELGLDRPDNRVEYELWYSSILDLTKDQLVDLGKYQKPFGNHTLFTPRIITFGCPTCPKSIREQACFSNGKYCPYQAKYRGGYDTDTSDKNVINSFRDRDERIQAVASKTPDRELLLSSLREKCLYNKIAKEDDTQTYKNWFNYMVFMQMQIAYNGKLDKQETDAGFDFMKIDHEEIEKCVNNSFERPGDYQSENKILKEDRDWTYREQIHKHPVISINNHTYQGDFTGRDIAIALCASFKDRPTECSQNMAKLAGDDNEYDMEKVMEDKTENEIYIIGVIIILFNICLICYHKQTAKKENATEINQEVNEAVATYFALRGDESSVDKTPSEVKVEF